MFSTNEPTISNIMTQEEISDENNRERLFILYDNKGIKNKLFQDSQIKEFFHLSRLFPLPIMVKDNINTQFFIPLQNQDIQTTLEILEVIKEPMGLKSAFIQQINSVNKSLIIQFSNAELYLEFWKTHINHSSFIAHDRQEPTQFPMSGTSTTNILENSIISLNHQELIELINIMPPPSFIKNETRFKFAIDSSSQIEEILKKFKNEMGIIKFKREAINDNEAIIDIELSDNAIYRSFWNKYQHSNKIENNFLRNNENEKETKHYLDMIERLKTLFLNFPSPTKIQEKTHFWFGGKYSRCDFSNSDFNLLVNEAGIKVVISKINHPYTSIGLYILDKEKYSQFWHKYLASLQPETQLISRKLTLDLNNFINYPTIFSFLQIYSTSSTDDTLRWLSDIIHFESLKAEIANLGMNDAKDLLLQMITSSHNGRDSITKNILQCFSNPEILKEVLKYFPKNKPGFKSTKVRELLENNLKNLYNPINTTHSSKKDIIERKRKALEKDANIRHKKSRYNDNIVADLATPPVSLSLFGSLFKEKEPEFDEKGLLGELEDFMQQDNNNTLKM